MLCVVGLWQIAQKGKCEHFLESKARNWKSKRDGLNLVTCGRLKKYHNAFKSNKMVGFNELMVTVKWR